MRRTAAPGSRWRDWLEVDRVHDGGIQPAASSNPCEVRGHMDKAIRLRLARREIAADVPASVVVLRAGPGEHSGTVRQLPVQLIRCAAMDGFPDIPDGSLTDPPSYARPSDAAERQ